MALTRRSLAKALAAAAVVRPSAPAQSAAQTDADLQSARDQLRSNIQQIAKVKLPMATEPAFHFKA
ncbi:MAG TPA: hypothetical protein VMT15_21630 [Bryobacteraceae bacterium]|nr:hypothetical protein [Bryobacteraceae bacterium]